MKKDKNYFEQISFNGKTEIPTDYLWSLGNVKVRATYLKKKPKCDVYSDEDYSDEIDKKQNTFWFT